MILASECVKNCIEGGNSWPVAIAAVVAAFVAAGFAVWRMSHELAHDRRMRMDDEFRRFIDEAGQQLLKATEVLRRALNDQGVVITNDDPPYIFDTPREDIDDEMYAVVGVGRRFQLHVATDDAILVSYSEATQRLVAFAGSVRDEPGNEDELGRAGELLAQADISVQEFLIAARSQVRPS